jgi:hypothetical protein
MEPDNVEQTLLMASWSSRVLRAASVRTVLVGVYGANKASRCTLLAVSLKSGFGAGGYSEVEQVGKMSL